jgi:hypothetical protein
MPECASVASTVHRARHQGDASAARDRNVFSAHKTDDNSRLQHGEAAKIEGQLNKCEWKVASLLNEVSQKTVGSVCSNTANPFGWRLDAFTPRKCSGKPASGVKKSGVICV